MSGVASHRVLRNTLWLVAAQAITAPLSFITNAVAARELGPDDFGHLYIATTFSAMALLFVEWGQSGAMTARIARERDHTGLLLGSGLAWRLCTAPLAILIVLLAGTVLGYSPGLRFVMLLVLLAASFTTVSSACLDALRGLERIDVSACAYAAWQLLTILAVVPTLLYGGGLHGMLFAQLGCAALGAVVMWRLLAPFGIRHVSARISVSRELVHAGTAFMIFNLVMVLQPNLDAIFLSKFASPQSVGWYAVARKLTGILIFPATALIASLYPALCRLRVEDPAVFRSTAAGALNLTTLAAAPVAMGCLLFPELGIRIFGGDSYGPAAGDLRLLAPYVLLLYMTMPLGTTLLAAGRERAWTAAQFICVIVSVVADPLLVPWLQQRTGNGGLGVCIATLASEILMLLSAFWLLPAGILTRSLLRPLGAAAAGAVAMVLVRLALPGINPWVTASLALLAYAITIGFTGGLEPQQRQQLLARVRRRTGTTPPAPL